MKQTWRWFGPKDTVSLQEIRQAGAHGIVTALHHIVPGTVWSEKEISDRIALIEAANGTDLTKLNWEVVESLPVSEDIKKQTGDWRAHIDAYRESLKNLAAAGLQVICYNFMPILDWTRTDLHRRLPSGATCMHFDLVDFAAFDLFILQRDGATFDDAITEAASARFSQMSDGEKSDLTRNIVFGLPGAAENMSLDDVRNLLGQYAGISRDRLRQNQLDFLEQVVPLAEDLGLRLCCHPDDPPFDLLGLPRVMSTEADYAQICAAIDSPANGITLCSGSLGVHPNNDLPGMMDRLGDKVHFLHLRNTRREQGRFPGWFYEAEHLDGDTDMIALIAAVLRQEKKRRDQGRTDDQIPMRPDHGQNIADDFKRDGQPGYPLIGRLRGLAEIRGVVAALNAAE